MFKTSGSLLNLTEWSLLYRWNSQRTWSCQSSFFHHLLQWASFLARGTARIGQCHSLLAQIPRAEAVTTRAGDQPDTGTGTALQPQSGAFCQLQPDSGPACCSVGASCQTDSSPLYWVDINHGRWDCQEWLMAHLHSQRTVMKIRTWKSGIEGFFFQEAPDCLCMDLLFLYITTSNVFFLEEVATHCSYTLCFTKPKFWSDNFAQFSTACSLIYVFLSVSFLLKA